MIKIVQEYAQTFTFCKQMTEEIEKISEYNEEGARFLINYEKLIREEINDRKWVLDVCDPEASECNLTAASPAQTIRNLKSLKVLRTSIIFILFSVGTAHTKCMSIVTVQNEMNPMSMNWAAQT